MNAQTPAWNLKSLPLALAVLVLALAVPVQAGGEELRQIERLRAVRVDDLDFEDHELEDRLARYEAVLSTPLTDWGFLTPTDPWAESGEDDGTGDRRRCSSLPAFADVAADLSAVSEPAEAVATAHRLTGTVGGRALYEELGVVLLREARLARFAEQDDRALELLATARHAFELADGIPRGKDATGGEKDFLHRAMLRLEEVVLENSGDAWDEAVDLLARQLEVTPDGPWADWALRIADAPETYVAETSPPLDVQPPYVGGDVKAPAKIFTPGARYSEAARQGRIQGVVILQVILDRNGTVTTLEVLKELPRGLTAEAIRTVAAWLFEPATRNGQPISVRYNLVVQFRH